MHSDTCKDHTTQNLNFFLFMDKGTKHWEEPDAYRVYSRLYQLQQHNEMRERKEKDVKATNPTAPSSANIIHFFLLP